MALEIPSLAPDASKLAPVGSLGIIRNVMRRKILKIQLNNRSMQDIQDIFNRIQQTKQKQKELRSAYKDALDSSEEYREIQDKMKTLRARKKQIETTVKEQFADELTKLEDMKIDIESDTEMMTDIAVSKMMKGESVELTDQNNNKYEPIFRVKFKKVF